MSDITEIKSTDKIKDSRTVINTNFENLNTDKLESPILETDITDGSLLARLAANETISGSWIFTEDITVTNKSRARAYRADTAQTIPTDEATKVQLNAETFDTLNEFDSTTNYRFTATKAGYYLVIGSAIILNLPSGKYLNTAIWKNGAVILYSRSYSEGGDACNTKISDVIYLDIGDYLELYVTQDSGGNLDLLASTYWTFMSIHKLS